MPIRLLVLFLFLFVAGCASYSDLPPGTALPVSGPPPVETELITVPAIVEEPPPADYRLGPGDVLFINVSGHPELGSPVVSGGSNKVAGSRIDGAGNLHLPLVGAVSAAGLTQSELQERLRGLYGRFLAKPWVVVEVAEFRSQPVYLLGQFRAPGTYYLERPTSLLQGLAIGGGISDAANLRSARLVRAGRTLPVDLRELIEEGGAQNNVWLRAGDTVFIPDDKNQNVFVFGAVSKPGPVPMPNGRLSLPQALAAAGLGEVRGALEYVRIIRSHSAVRGELIVIDARQALRGGALPYPLLEGDIVYVPRSAVGNWNQAIQEILPSLQAVSAILQPFVQVKFLTDEDD